MFSVASIIYGWDNQLNYAQALLADLTDEQMMRRPGGAMNHAKWILGHVTIYHPVIVKLIAGETFPDAKDDPKFGFAGQGPVDDPAAYESKDAMVARFVSGHEQVAQALLKAGPEAFARKPSLERWAKLYPTIEFMLPDLLLHHESLHIGQISIWRRAAGLPGVKMPPRAIRAGLI
jgi:uncharacterized damage-inducible protein DinB